MARLLLPDKTDISFVNDYKGAELSYSTYSDGMAARSKCALGRAPARLLRLLWARLVALVGSTHSQGEPKPLGAQPLPRVLELAAAGATEGSD